MTQSLALRTARYILEVLGIDVGAPRPWERSRTLPYYLRDAFDWCEISVLGHPVVLAIDLSEGRQPLRDVKTKLDKARTLNDQPILYVTSALASYERRQLVDYKLSFVVPGNQLYIPELGIDLREYFRQRAATQDVVGPATQAVFITMMLQPQHATWPTGNLAQELGYTSMTLSRAVRELSHLELVEIHGHARGRRLSLAAPPAELWERALPWLRSPVKGRHWTSQHRLPPILDGAPLAGLSALSRATMLSEPRSPVHAVSAATWKAAAEMGLDIYREWRPNAIEWQVWTYPPPSHRKASCVDPLSLTLSLRDERDERVQMALDVLREEFPW
ncbi:MAG: hypothetical protein ACLGIN_13705 [Candidatus Sericytochromatia bacterium]